MSIQVKQLTKVYGHQKAVDNISFEVRQGEILGFLGPNGAGKSTTMKIATTFLPPTEGTVEVNGFDVVENTIEVRKCIGYLPEHNPLYLDMYVHEYLCFIGSLHGLKGKNLKERVKEVVVLFGLKVEQNKKIGSLSKGYRQRVGLAQALIHDPQVLILDEPTTGLDPNQLIEIRSLIKDISREKTVIFSTHIMQEVQAICDRVVIIDSGKIVADNVLSQLGADNSVTLHVEFLHPVATEKLSRIHGIISIEETSPSAFLLKASTNQDIRPEIFRFAAQNGYVLIGLRKEDNSLEKVFQKLTNPVNHV